MTTYKWGKFNKESNYRNEWSDKQIDWYDETISYISSGKKLTNSRTWTALSNNGLYEMLQRGEVDNFSDIDNFNFRDYEINDSEGISVPSNDERSCKEIFKSGDIHVSNRGKYKITIQLQIYPDRKFLAVSKEKGVEKKVFDGYTRVSKIGTVTSSNRRAYPDNGESGSYWYVYEGIANQTPTISGQDEDWGGYKQAFKRYYSVDDGDSGQQLNVVVTLNGVTIASVNNATRKSDYPIDIDDSKFNALTLNEQNTIEITVTDSSGATAVRRYTFKRINTAPVVTMTNAHYGEQNKPFTINFEAADPDGDEITAKLFIDDVQIKDLGTIKGKQSVTIPKIDFAKIPNGEHKIRVEAKDSYNAVGAGYADFSKNLTYAWYRLKKELSEQPSAVIVNPLAELAPGAKMTIKVCSNVMDAQPTWETVPEELYGQKYNFRNTSKTGDKWGVGVEIRIDKEKATEESYLYGFVGAYM